MLHPTKSQSILQWFNSMITKGAIQSLSELSDGFHFHDIITTINELKKRGKHLDAASRGSDNLVNDPNISTLSTIPTEAESVKDESNAESNTSGTEMVIDEATPKSLKETETDVSVSEEEEKTVVNSNKGKNDAEIEKIYEFIKEFIDDFFDLDSSSIITYVECMKGKELELAKVAVLLLSAMVQVFLSSNNEQLYTTTLLDLQVQEDIKECLSLVLEVGVEDGPLKKSELNRILSRPSKSKGTPRRRTPSRGTSEVLETPDSSKYIPKKRKDRTTILAEEVFESPLKSLLESPKLQFKAAIFKKDAEIYKLRENLHAEETKVIDLTIEKRSLNAELEKKKRELEFLKEEHRKLQECADEVDAYKKTEFKDVLAEKERNNKIIHDLKEEMEVYKKENENLHTEVADLKEKLSHKSNINQVDYKQQCVTLAEKVKELELNITLKESKIADLKNAAITRDRSLKAYKRIYDEKRQEDIKKTGKSITDTIPETASNIIYADQCLDPILKNECDVLRNKLEEEKEKVKKLENDLKKALNEETKVNALNSKISDLKSDLDSSNKQLEIYKQLPKTMVNNGSILNMNEEMASGNLLGSLPVSLWRNASPDGSERDDRLWDTYSGKSIETRSRSASALGYQRDNDAEFLSLRKVARAIAKILIKKSNAAEVQHWNHLEEQARCLGSIKDICVFYQSLLDSLKSTRMVIWPSVLDLPSKRKSRSQTVEETDPNMLYLNCKKKESELEAIKQDMSNLKKEFKSKLEDSKAAEDKYKELELHVKELSDKLEKSQQDVKDAKGKYEFTKKCVENLNKENKKLLRICKALKDDPVPKVEPCKDCKILREKLSDVKQDRNDFEKDSVELKALVRDFECKNRNLERQLKNEINEKKKLEFRIQRESAFLSGSMSERNAVVHRYFQQGLAESKKAKIRADNEKKSQLPQPQQVVSFNTYILNHETKEPCPENSISNANTYANRSIRSGFLQTDDEEDFLNHSSLAQIHREVFPEPEANDRRLTEIQRRNTLCLPHLQSSYPLELQNMTPTERKYFDKLRAPVQPYQKTLGSTTEKGAFSELIGESEDSQDVQPLPVRKRKVSDMERVSIQPAKKAVRSSSQVRLVQKVKPITPVRKTGFISKTKSFKTPTSIRRLMRMPHKNKNQ